MPQSPSGATPNRETSDMSSETNRLAALRHYEILDTVAEQAFDDLSLLTARLCETPIALITLVDESRQWFKSKVGISFSETPREHSFCAHTIRQRAIFTVSDARTDQRFSSNPLVVSEPQIRFYAGVPLVTANDQALGTICVMDRVPRELTAEQLESLQMLSRQVMNQLELRLKLREGEKAIQERDLRQASLHRHERLLNTILETLPVSVNYLNSRAEFQLTNPADAALWAGARQPAAHEINNYKLWRAELQQRIRDENWGVVRAIADGAVTLQELKEIECWDGTHKSILHSGVPLRDADQRIKGAIAVNEDITALKRMEAALRESRTRFRQVVENIDGVFWMTNVEKNQMLYISPGYERIWGRPCEELYDSPHSWAEALHPEDRERVVNKSQADMQLVGGYDEEYRIVRPDGSVRWIRDRAFPVKDEGGKSERIVGIATDITEQRKTEELLRQSESEFRVIFENAPIGMALVDPEGHPTRSNPALQRLLGYTEEELRGMTFKEFTHPEDAEQGWNLYEELLGGKRQDYQIEKRYVRKGGEVISVRLTVSLIHGASHDRICALGMVEDITEKKQLESQFMRAQRLESIGMLAGGIAHDLNNLLAPIVMSCGLLKQEANAETRSKLLAAIDASATRGTELVKQITTFARGRERSLALLQPEQLIEEVINIIRHAFPKQISIRKEVLGKLWELWGDSTQLHQVLLNLCVNARDAMPTGGELTIGAHNILVDENRAAKNPELKPGPHLVISIMDTGAGIAPDILEKIFDPFFTTKGAGKGTGLGLSTVLGIAKSHGGCITLSSEVGKGSQFDVWLPASASDKPAPPQLLEGQAMRGRGKLMLVVDDEAAVLVLTRQMLEAYGYKVLTADNGMDAIGICAGYMDTLQAVMTDMLMPGMDGADLIRNLLDINPALRIIALSGASKEEFEPRALEAGAKMFMSKPFTVESLLKSIHELLPDH